MTTDPDMALGGNLGKDLIMASTYLSISHFYRVSSSTFLESI